MSEKLEIVGKGPTYLSDYEGDYWLIRLTHENGDECLFILQEVAIIHSLKEVGEKNEME